MVRIYCWLVMFKLPAFRNPALLQQALTHRSFVNEHPGTGEHNERLEFLGDAVLNFLSGEFLYERYPAKPEGELTPLRSTLVDEQQFAKFAIALGLDQPDVMRLGRGAALEGGRTNPNLLSSTFEAVIGAYFLDADSDVEAVRAYVEPLFRSVVDHLAIAAPQINFKSRLQEWALANVSGKPKPEYVVTNQFGADHAKTFTVQVQIGGQVCGEGSGHRKQDAEKSAAEDALRKLGI
jgi:ribonuclease III